MPEGPSIVILKEDLRPFIGKKVLEVQGNARIDLSRMKGEKIIDIRSWGKHLLICFHGFYLRIHLLMFGSARINERKETSPRLLLLFRTGEASFYACSVRMMEGHPADEYDWSGDTMSDEWNEKQALSRVRKDRDAMVCDVLMDQEIFAGIGNIIKNEVLFLSRVHPESVVRSIPLKKLKELVHTGREYCFDFYRWKKKFELKKNYKVYSRAACPECGGKITRKHTGIRERRSFFCLHCQLLYE